MQDRTESDDRGRFLFGSQTHHARGEDALALAAGARCIAPRRRELRRGAIEIATEIGDRALERAACLERTLTRRFELGQRLVPG